jgi:hypothetical protein
MHAGVTRVRFAPGDADKVVHDLQTRIVDAHKKLRSEGMKDAFFLVNRESGEAIGVALWDDKEKLRKVEGKNSREDPSGVRDPKRANTDFAKLRAQAVQDEGATLENTDWYEVVART